jgi:alanyl-tRNA synthetase
MAACLLGETSRAGFPPRTALAVSFLLIVMTVRLYYQNSFLYDFIASVEEARELADGRRALVLDRTAFYPTSGGQPFDTGWVEFVSADNEAALVLPGPKLRVSEVIEDESDGTILHVVENLAVPLALPLRVRGFIDVDRRQDHMQQHSGQHVLSAAFLKLFEAATVSFHMGEESCTIDLEIAHLGPTQLEQAERHANQIVWEDRQVLMHEATAEQARKAGVRKIPEAAHETLRLIEVRGVDLCACGGTHVLTTGQIGNIQLRKVDKVKQGIRVEFVCGLRALHMARKDFEVLTEAAAIYSGQLWEVPAQSRKLMDSGKAAQKQQQKLLAEIAELTAQQALAHTAAESGYKIVSEYFAERDLAFVKLYAQRLVAAEANVIALIGAGQGTPALVFAQSVGAPSVGAGSSGGGFDAGAELRAMVSSAGGRGGGTRDFAQGGVPSADLIPQLIERAAQTARAQCGMQSGAQPGAQCGGKAGDLG